MRLKPYFIAATLVLVCLQCTNENTTSSTQNTKENTMPSQTRTSTNSSENTIPKGSTIAFYNVENLFDTYDDPSTYDEDFTPEGKKRWTKKRYDKKIDRIAEVLHEIDGSLPAVIGLVEIENRKVLEDLIHHRTLARANYAISHEESKDERGIDVALLYKKDLFISAESKSFFVSLRNDYTRDILLTSLEFAPDRFLQVFVNHWPSKREGPELSNPKRALAAKTLLSGIEWAEDNMGTQPLLIMGDFNDTPEDASIAEVLMKGNSSLINLASQAQKNVTNGSIGTQSYKGNWSVLDQIMINSAFQKEISPLGKKDFKILDSDHLLFQHPRYKTFSPDRTYAGDKYIGAYSDHLPVYVTL